MSRTKTTESFYRSVAQSLLGDCPHWRQDPMQSVRHIEALCATRAWSVSTWRIYRAALSWFLTESGFPEAADLILRVAQGGRQGALRLAQKKQKSLPAADLLTLDRDIGSRRTRYADVARLWLWAGVLTGLRPGEWRETALSANGLVLTVRNAKHTNGRANGAHRHLHLDAMNPDERAAIARMVELATSADDFTRLYHRVRKIVRESAKRCWPQRARRPSLYSARHQWAANAKRIYGKRAVAALAGHASEATAGIHYARRQKGEQANLPEPEPQDLDRVRRADPPHPFSGGKPTVRDRHAD